MTVIAGPMPCKSCGTLVTYAVYGRLLDDRSRSVVRTRGMLEVPAQRVHRCPAEGRVAA